MVVILIFFILVLLLYRYTRRHQKSSIGSGLLLLLLVMLGSSFFLGLSRVSYGEALFLPTFYLVLIFLIWLNPYVKIRMDSNLISKSGSMEYAFSILIIILVLPSSIYYLGKVIEVFSGNADSMLEVRHVVNNADVSEERSWSIVNYFIAGAQFYVIALYMFFVSLAKGWKKIITILLLVGSFSFPLYCLSRMGRDGVVFWAINTLLLFNMFKKTINEETRKKLSIGISVFSIIVLVFLLVISTVRFSSSYFIEGTVGYIGQSVPNFSILFGSPVDYSLTMFPGLYSMLGIRFTNYANLLVKNGYYDLTNSFSSFVPNLFLSYGYVGAVAVSLVVMFLIIKIRQITYLKGSNYGMMIMLVIMQVPMNGVFYYRQGIGNGDVYLLLSIILLFLYPKMYKFLLRA